MEKKDKSKMQTQVFLKSNNKKIKLSKMFPGCKSCVTEYIARW